MKVSDLKNNPTNPRVIKDDKFKKLVKSLQEFPEMMEKRPMVCVTDIDGKIYPLGGNMRLKAIKELQMKEIPDNWVQMADDWTEDQRKEFIIKDNVGFGEWDFEELQGWDVEQLEEWGLDMPELKEEIEIKDLFNIEIPFYNPSEIKPLESELIDLSKYENLKKDIEELEINNDLKEFLLIRASFFADFNFQKIADYYYHEEEKVKNIFNKLGLVILAPKEALKNGFIDLSENVLEL